MAERPLITSRIFERNGSLAIGHLRHGELDRAFGTLQPPQSIAVAIATARLRSALIEFSAQRVGHFFLERFLDNKARGRAHELALLDRLAVTAGHCFDPFARDFRRRYSCQRDVPVLAGAHARIGRDRRATEEVASVEQGRRTSVDARLASASVLRFPRAVD